MDQRAFLLALLLFTVSSCARNPVTGKKEVHIMSEKAELNLGLESRNEIVKEYGLINNPKLQAYINEVGQRVVKVCERQGIQYEFVLLDTPLVNAFAVPGVVFLTRGILDLIDDEAELASVIGHEVGHITNYHSVKLIQKQYGYGFLATFAAVAGTIYTPTLRDPREYAAYYDTLYRGIGLVTAGFLSGYGRQFELEADQSGLRYAVLAGYDPDAMASFFKRLDSLARDEATGLELFLRTHPPTKDRIAEVKKELSLAESSVPNKKKGKIFENRRKIAEVLSSTVTKQEDNFERYQEIVRSIPRMDSDSEGAVRGSTYTHQRLGISLEVPSAWHLERGYGKALVSFSTKDGKAQGELQYKRFAQDPLLVAQSKAQIAGVTKSTELVTAQEWAESVEPSLKLQKRTGREVTYPFGQAYVGTYYGIDRVGRPAFIKIHFIVRGKERAAQDGFVVFCGAPNDNYLDYLLDFERIVASLRFK